MARDFVAASSQKLKVATAVRSTLPMSFACWFKPVADGVLYTLVGIDDNVNQGWLLGWNGPTNSVRWHVNATLTAVSGNGGGAGTWSHCGGILTSATSRACVLNGSVGSTNSTNISPSSVSQTQIGVRFASSNFANGTIAEVGIWNVALAAADWAALGGTPAASPLMVRPDALIFYAPLIGSFSPEIDEVGRNEMTVTGASQVAHPRIIYPTSLRAPGRMIFTAAPTGGGRLVEGGALINSNLLRGGRLVAA